MWSGRKRTIKQMPRIVCCYRFMGLFVTRRLMTQLSPGPDLERRIWNKLCAPTVTPLTTKGRKSDADIPLYHRSLVTHGAHCLSGARPGERTSFVRGLLVVTQSAAVAILVFAMLVALPLLC